MAINFKVCPKCGSKRNLKIIYGEPTIDLFEESKKGKVRLGGCCVPIPTPQYYCCECEYEWNKEEIIDLAYRNIKKIKAFVGGYFGDNYNVVIDISEGEVSWAEGFNSELQLVKSITGSEIESFTNALKLMKVLNWKRKYIEPDICDGTQWFVEIETKGNAIRINGSNKYPSQWNKFCSTISELIEKPFE